MHKFFVNDDQIVNDKIYITGADLKHLSKVLRIRIGEQIKISSTGGMEFLAEVTGIDKENACCHVLESYQNAAEPNVNVVLFQGLPKAAKMDLIVQKCVEIGIARIQPVITKRVIVDVQKKELTGKIDRWNRISEEAAKQSGRGIIPKVDEPISFDEAVKMTEGFDITIIPYENEKGKGIRNITAGRQIKTAGIFIGPEGGFEAEEIERISQIGGIPVTLGPRILRTETAGFIACAFLLFEAGDMGGIV